MLELKNINKRFGERQILKNFNLNVPEKKILAIVGQSGGGKTTLLRLWRDASAALTVCRRQLEFLRERPVLRRPLEKIQRMQIDIEEKAQALMQGTTRRLEKSAARLTMAQARLEGVSPFSVMKRGYAMILDEKGQPVILAANVQKGQMLQIAMQDGRLEAAVMGKAVRSDGEKKTVL